MQNIFDNISHIQCVVINTTAVIQFGRTRTGQPLGGGFHGSPSLHAAALQSRSRYVRVRAISRSTRMSILPDFWNRYDWEQSPCLSLDKKHGSLASQRKALCSRSWIHLDPMVTMFVHTTLQFWPIQNVHLLCPPGNDTDYNIKRKIFLYCIRQNFCWLKFSPAIIFAKGSYYVLGQKFCQI